MTPEEKKKIELWQSAYAQGVEAYKSGLGDNNPYGRADIMQMCSWYAGYCDAKRGMV